MIKSLFVLLCLCPCASFASGSVIGNGGDPLFHFLEATRYSLVETVKLILVDKVEREKFCQTPKLSVEQIQTCRTFLFTVAEQILSLNQGLNKIVFILKEDPLYVEGPGGKKMPVSARTTLGPAGDIEFHRDSIKLMAPVQILFLLAHEFNHKSEYQGRYVTDNETIAPFATGRELLDSVASAIVDVAKRKGKIGRQYGLRDSFTCLVLVNKTKFGIRTSTPRLFLTEDLMSYETSLSRNPTDPIIFVPESPTSDLVFRMVTTEPANCSDEEKYSTGRQTELSIMRQSKSSNGNEPPKEEVLVQQTWIGYNPLCEKKADDLTLTFGNTTFACRFFGTEGTTSSALMINKR